MILKRAVLRLFKEVAYKPFGKYFVAVSFDIVTVERDHIMEFIYVNCCSIKVRTLYYALMLCITVFEPKSVIMRCA